MSSIEILKQEQSEKFSRLQSNLDQIKVQNTELQTTVEFLSTKYDDMLDKMARFENERKSTIEYVRSLEEKIENLERNAKSSSLEIRNVPKTTGETKDVLINIVKNIGIAVNTEILPNEIKDVYRLSNNRNPQVGGPITADFTSTITKDKFLSNIKKYNRDNRTNRLNSSHLNMSGNIPIFVSEALTTKAKKLYYTAREFTKLNNYAYHWTSQGKVYIKKQEGAPSKRIDKESDFDSLKQNEK